VVGRVGLEPTRVTPEDFKSLEGQFWLLMWPGCFWCLLALGIGGIAGLGIGFLAWLVAERSRPTKPVEKIQICVL
jgi:hypothetical protein